MSWEKLKEMNLFDKVENHLKSISEKDSKVVEDIITSPDNLKKFKECIHVGMDSSTIANRMCIGIEQVDIIKDMLGKL